MICDSKKWNISQAREDINLDADEASLNYDCEKKPLKPKTEKPSDVDFMSELSRGRFSMTANVNHDGKICTAKIFDKTDAEGEDPAKREFKNLKALKHERLVSEDSAFYIREWAGYVGCLPGVE